MKKLSVFICVNLWLIFFCFSVSAQEFKTIQDGIEYAEMKREIDKTPVKMNLLRLDLTKVRLDVIHAMDAAIGVEKTSSIAARHGAIAAINAGFFRLDSSIFGGDAVGILQIDGKLLSESSNNRIAIGITNGKDKTEVNFGHLDTKLSLNLGIDSSISVSGVNRERKSDEVVIFTPEFGQTTLTTPNGSEFLVKTSIKNPFVGNVIKISKDKGSSPIQENHFIISANGEKSKELGYFFKKLMSVVRFSIQFNVMEKEKQIFFSKAEDITNGVPQLIKNGKIEITWEQEKASKSFYETKHPRTAVAKLKDGRFLMVTVDGRSESSGGINLEDLAKLLLEFGATDAMNLDGGGSTTMFLDGKIVNKPSDKEGERKVSDAILVTLRKKN